MRRDRNAGTLRIFFGPFSTKILSVFWSRTTRNGARTVPFRTNTPKKLRYVRPHKGYARAPYSPHARAPYSPHTRAPYSPHIRAPYSLHIIIECVIGAVACVSGSAACVIGARLISRTHARLIPLRAMNKTDFCSLFCICPTKSQQYLSDRLSDKLVPTNNKFWLNKHKFCYLSDKSIFGIGFVRQIILANVVLSDKNVLCDQNLLLSEQICPTNCPTNAIFLLFV